jgi:hypothetical protein
MLPTTKITLTFLATFAVGCSATDAPTVEFTNGAGKNDEVSLAFQLDAGDSIDIGLECELEAGCDIVLSAADEFSGAFDGTIDVTVTRPDGFSRTDNLFFTPVAEMLGGAQTAYFGQEAGYYAVTVTNNTGADRRLVIGASWTEARADTGAPVGDPCTDVSQCAEGQVCLGAGGGQVGFCTSSCGTIGQMRCDLSGSLCIPIDQAQTELYCFAGCDAMSPDCGGEHLECIPDAGTDGFGNEFGLCTISAELEGDGVDNDGDGETN